MLPAACRVGPDYKPPAADLPDAWTRAALEGFESGEPILQAWWTALGDPVLEQLIARAAENNRDLAAAFARIEQARALRGIATGERFPDLDGTGFAERSRVSEDILPVTPTPRVDSFMGLGTTGFWEIDLWGRISRSIESADAGLQSSVEQYRDVLVLLYAQVGLGYVDLRALQERIAFVLQNIDRQRNSVELTRDRFDSGISPELDLRQAELNLANTESALPSLREALARSRYRLAVLVGAAPAALDELLAAAAPVPTPPSTVAVGIPKNILRQRPDIRAAERALAARTADIGVATANLYPTLGLRGNFGYEATTDLLDPGNRAYAGGLSAMWNLFDGGRVRGDINRQWGEAHEARANYEQIVLLALEEVENALVAYVEESNRLETLTRSVAAAERSVELVNTLYRNGLTDFQNVLDTERSLFQQQDSLAESRGRVVGNLIDLYRALGGGWQPDTTRLQAEIEDQESGEAKF